MSVWTNLEEGNEMYFQEENNYISSYYLSSACPMPGAIKGSLHIFRPGFWRQHHRARMEEQVGLGAQDLQRYSVRLVGCPNSSDLPAPQTE